MMNSQNSVFHEGELAIQERLGVAEKMAQFGKMVIRDYMPKQHCDFYQQLPMIFTGHQDSQGQVWASVLSAKPGFIKTPNNKSLRISAPLLPGDPLAETLKQNVRDRELRLGLLGIELETRRRNRLSAKVKSNIESEIELDVLQTFGNCPQYIQSRELSYYESAQSARVSSFHHFDALAIELISGSDTFFVASSSGEAKDETHGADVSHRGGNPGFIKVESDTELLIPDFTGNNHYNTLGNFQLNPAAGLLFIDFKTGDVLTLTGKAEIVWQHSLKAHFKGAERFWRFRLTAGHHIQYAFPWRFTLQSWSPNTLMTGTWQEAESNAAAELQRNQWHKFTVTEIKDESPTIRSFWLSSEKISAPEFKAGQFITVRAKIRGEIVSRNYSVSSSPHEKRIRISVKKYGIFSRWLHGNISSGDELEIRLPQGQFFLETSDKPAILLSAGVGITPMISMFRYSVQESLRARKPREILMINTFSKVSEQAFVEEINQLSSQTEGYAKAIWAVTSAETNTRAGKDYSVDGRIDQSLLQQVLPLGSYHFYLCGPATFMQDMYDLLIRLGVPDKDIKAESFGPASLKRVKQIVQAESQKAIVSEVAENAVVSFTQSQVEQTWSPEDGNLLDFAEAHGLTPEFGCRAGSCGSCIVNITQGEVVHDKSKTFATEKDEILLCCAKPRKGKDDQPVKVSITI
ncbi:2Fe-2S iron-sulfur cluster-binding protein [Planctobacterium marinum]|uniref:Uncharacterized protein n=1 Tax=Planctobacterium marinum TaxID=1631968 RepID=A0AA48HVR9_9ALTE|nr:hypothetical protein MACH26_22690 [Planctobacterium marinum]